MNLVLIANNVTSAIVILGCWWLAHINAKARPPGRALAVAYSLLGFFVLSTLVVRNLGVDLEPALPWMLVLVKSGFSVVIFLTIYRRFKLGDR